MANNYARRIESIQDKRMDLVDLLEISSKFVVNGCTRKRDHKGKVEHFNVRLVAQDFPQHWNLL